MPNENLIAALQTLQDEYTQKQKTANNLLKSLKGKASAFGKAQQSLGDYAATNEATDNVMLQQVQQSFSAAQESVTPLLAKANRDVKTFATLNASLKSILSALNSTPIDVIKFSQPFQTLKAIEIQDSQIASVLPELEHELEQAQQALGMVFGSALRDAFAAQGLTVGGTPPKFEVGRFEINANFFARSASISYGKELVVKRVPLSVDAILKAYQTAAKSIMGRNENPETWLVQFYTAWNTARQKRNDSDPRANIVDCYFELAILRQVKTFFSAPSKASFVDYTRAQFAYDLQELAVRPHQGHKGLVVFAHAATKSQTDSMTKSLWVVEGNAPHDGRYIGDIVFDKDE